jgi:uncharacterized protein (TIGR03435 family)
MNDLIVRAYGLLDQRQVAGAAWITTDSYRIEVRMPRETTEPQFQQMLQTLLADRFHLALHRDTVTLPVYQLVVGKDGHKLKPSTYEPGTDAPNPADVRELSKQNDEDGFPRTPAGYKGEGLRTERGPAGTQMYYWVYSGTTMPEFARQLQILAGRLVVDKTGLAGVYDVRMKVERDAPGVPALLTVFEAVQKQLGLKLVDTKDMFEQIVVDRGENIPTEN